MTWLKPKAIAADMYASTAGNNTYSVNATARASIFSLSRLVVGSSSAKIPHCELNVSARAILKK